MRKICNNCKYYSEDAEYDVICKAKPYYDEENEVIRFKYIQDERYAIKCPQYKLDLQARVKQLILSIRLAYYKWKFPENFV